MPRPTDGQCCRVISRDGLTPTAPQAEVGRQVQGPGSSRSSSPTLGRCQVSRSLIRNWSAGLCGAERWVGALRLEQFSEEVK